MVLKVIGYITLVLLVATGCFLILRGYTDIKYKNAYIASNYQQVVIYDEDFDQIVTLPRGTKVKYLNKVVNYQNKKFYQIKYKFDNYYIETKNITTSKQKIILEEILYLRTTSTLYNDQKKIITLINKGEAVEVIGFKSLNADGSVFMYKVRYQNYVGYLYSKYLVNDLDIALSYRTGNLDYYPMEKHNFINNVMPSEVRAVYLNDIPVDIKQFKENKINSVIIDIDKIKASDKLKDFYLIGKIKVSNIDDIKNWERILQEVKKAIAFYGFNEINFDNVITKENDAKKVQDFLIYASEELHQMNTYISVSVDPQIASNKTINGQNWQAISNVVDVISPKTFIELNVKEPYKLLNSWASNDVAKIQAEIPTPAKVRSWFKAGDDLEDQIAGLYNAGFKDGYMIYLTGGNDEKIYFE